MENLLKNRTNTLADAHSRKAWIGVPEFSVIIVY
jgi:hypothetical protein